MAKYRSYLNAQK